MEIVITMAFVIGDMDMIRDIYNVNVLHNHVVTFGSYDYKCNHIFSS